MDSSAYKERHGAIVFWGKGAYIDVSLKMQLSEQRDLLAAYDHKHAWIRNRLILSEQMHETYRSLEVPVYYIAGGSW